MPKRNRATSHWLRAGVSLLVDVVVAFALYLRGHRPAASRAPVEARLDLATALAGLQHLEALAHLAEIDNFLRVANYEAYLRLLGASVVAWIVGNQVLGTPNVALEAVAVSIVALLFVIVSTAMQALWAEGLALREATEDLTNEIESLRGARSDDERSLHFRRATVIATGRLERAIRAGERSTYRTRRVTWALGQVPWILAAIGGVACLVVAVASLLSGASANLKATAALLVYGAVWTWSGYMIRRHFAPRTADLAGTSGPTAAKKFLSVTRRARLDGRTVTVVQGRAER